MAKSSALYWRGNYTKKENKFLSNAVVAVLPKGASKKSWADLKNRPNGIARLMRGIFPWRNGAAGWGGVTVCVCACVHVFSSLAIRSTVRRTSGSGKAYSIGRGEIYQLKVSNVVSGTYNYNY